MNSIKTFRFFILCCIAALVCSCTNLEQQVDRSVNDLTAAERRIDANVANSVEVLKGIKDDYPKEVKSIINNDIDRLLKTTIGTAGTEFRCEADFLRKRIKLGIQNTIIKLKNLLVKKGGTPAPLLTFPPSFCNCNPEQIDLNEANTKPLIIFGYDFDNFKKIKVMATAMDGSKKDISQLLAKPSDYSLTLGTNDQSNFKDFNKVEFFFNDTSLYSLLIIPKAPQFCHEEDKVISPVPQSINFFAIGCGGDPEYAGDVDVNISARLELSTDQKSINCHISFRANESDGDTRGCYEGDQIVYTAPTGFKIKNILTPKIFGLAYTQKGNDPLPVGGNGFVVNGTVRADHKGDDVPGYTGAQLNLANITVALIEDGTDCVEKAVYIKEHPVQLNSAVEQVKKMVSDKQLLLIKQIDNSKK
ncbi:hypothetical protein [Ferruginibacter sp. SUN106]|uniref:hypothetical protein n=1 Tax=Ferruginibacter sp. SUN106 TaxID=2978348 RepID=UPI003D36BEDB